MSPSADHVKFCPSISEMFEIRMDEERKRFFYLRRTELEFNGILRKEFKYGTRIISLYIFSYKSIFVLTMFSLQGSYKYGGKVYPSSAMSQGSSMTNCRLVALKALKVNESTCTHMKCTFGGVWNGGGGDGQKNMFVASFFFDRAAEVRVTIELDAYQTLMGL